MYTLFIYENIKQMMGMMPLMIHDTYVDDPYREGFYPVQRSNGLTVDDGTGIQVFEGLQSSID